MVRAAVLRVHDPAVLALADLMNLQVSRNLKFQGRAPRADGVEPTPISEYLSGETHCHCWLSLKVGAVVELICDDDQ